MSRRLLTLMAVLLVLIAAYQVRPSLMAFFDPEPTGSLTTYVPPLPGKNSVSNLVVRRDNAGVWQATFDYYYTGEPRWVSLHVTVPHDADARNPSTFRPMTQITAERGAHSVTVDLPYPSGAGTTRKVVASMNMAAPQADPAATRAEVDQPIVWPNWDQYEENKEFSRHSSQENLQRAIAFIDADNEAARTLARSILEKLVAQNPSLVQAYIELARLAMKSNWGPEGLHHAEGLLSSALQIAPDDVNAKILLGYVYAHQQRYPAAEKLFVEAAATNPPNLWLWTNWGELLAMQGKVDQAAAKFHEAVERPMTHDTYDRARNDAYIRLLALLERKNDMDGLEALYKKSVAEFGDASSYNLRYAYFLLTQRGDAAGAIQHASGALDVQCSCVRGREIVGLAQYTIWAKSEGAARAEALNQARIYLPPGPQSLYLLARSERTAGIAAQLIAAGEKIDQRDNEKLNALAHAISNDDLQAAGRLLRLGAKPETPVGYDDMPVALMPVLSRDLEMVKLLQQFGADYARISYHGATALDFAKQTGDPGLRELLAQRRQTL